MSTRRRLTLALVAVVGFGFAVFIPWLMRDLRPRYLATMEETMVDAAYLLAHSAASTVRDGHLQAEVVQAMVSGFREDAIDAKIYAVHKRSVDAWIIVTDDKGIVLGDSHDPTQVGADHSQWRDVARTLRGEYGARTTWEEQGKNQEEVLHVAAPIRDRGRLVGVLSLVKPARSIAVVVDQARSAALIAGSATAGSMLILGLLITWWMTRPIARLTEHVRDLQTGQRRPLPPLGASDLVTLGLAFEAMRDALDGRVYIENYVQTLTHEMKSPLAALRAAAELLNEDLPEVERQRFLANLRSEVTRLHDLIERLLQLSSLERRRTVERPETCDLRSIVVDVNDSLAASARSRNLTVMLPEPGLALVRGECFLIRQAVANLVQNALDFSPPGAAVTISIERQEDRWLLIIDDVGSGLPDFAHHRIFERFFSLPRPDGSRKGTGLGLPLVREVAALHGGTATVTNRPTGGARATMSLPAD